MIRGTKATIHLSDEWKGPPSRQFDFADIFSDNRMPMIRKKVRRGPGSY